MIRAITNSDLKYDHLLHGAVAGGVTVLQSAIALHEDNSALGHHAALLSTAAASAAGLQAGYHLSLFGSQIMGFNGKEDSSTPIRTVMRHFLTTIALIAAAASYGYEVVQLNREPPILGILSLIALLAMRILDSVIDNGFQGLIEAGEENNGKLVLVHLLLAAAVTCGWIQYAELDKNRPSYVIDQDELVYLLGAIAASAHVALEPLARIVDYLLSGYTVTAFNRYPIVRQIVSTFVLLTTAYATGYMYSGVDAKWGLAGLIAYTVADAVGRGAY